MMNSDDDDSNDFQRVPRVYRPTVPCRAHSSRTGLPCRRASVNGAYVCATHNGQNAAVRRKAAERLAKAVPEAIQHLVNAMRKAAAADDFTAVISACKAILDRAGFGPNNRVELSGPQHGPADLRAQEFRLEDFTVETQRMMLRDMRAASERRALQAAQEVTEDQDDPIDVQHSEWEG